MRTFAYPASLSVLALTVFFSTSQLLYADQTISGMKVGVVEAGNDGKVASVFKQIKKKTWAEYDPKGKLGFQFEEVARDEDQVVLYDKKRDLTIVLDLAAGIVTFGQPESQEQLYDIIKAKPAPNNVALASSKTGTEIDQFIRTLEYDPDAVVARSLEGSTFNKNPEGIPPKRENGRVTITTRTAQKAGGPVDQFTLINPATAVIYPGSIILVDTKLADGKATPVTVKKSAITISVDLGGSTALDRTIEVPTKSSVEKAIQSILSEYHAQGGERVQNAHSVMSVTRVYSKVQAAAALNIAAEWASGDASAKLEGSNDSDKEVVVAFFKQKYYTVTYDSPEAPSSVFDKDLPVDALQVVIDNDHPPGYISSVDYGRLVMVRMETTKSDTKIHAEAAFSQKFGDDGKAKGDLSADYKAVLDNSTFTAIVLGGNPKGTAAFTGNIEQLQSYIEDGAVFDEKNPGEPIAYTVRFLKDNTVASVNLTTDYLQTDTTFAKDGYIDMYNGCACTVRFNVSYALSDEPSAERFADDVKLAGHRYIDLPGDAQSVKMIIQRYETFGGVQTTYNVPGLETTSTGAPAVCVSTAGTFFEASANVKPGRC